jgi:hypothetical protein
LGVPIWQCFGQVTFRYPQLIFPIKHVITNVIQF